MKILDNTRMEVLADRDERLAAVLAGLAGCGNAADLESAARAHPDLADELRRLWATAQFASAFAHAALTHTPLPGPARAPLPVPDSFGDYAIIEELGRGGMGVVYRAMQKSLRRPVAVKLMRDARLASENDRARFRAEASSAARLKHPNIVTVHEVGEHDGQPYFAMEFVDGPPLSRFIAEHGLIPVRAAAGLVAEIARAVQHAHEQGILHRDLKPANILLKAENRTGGAAAAMIGGEPGERDAAGSNIHIGEPKITDFGLAKRLPIGSSIIGDSRTQTGAILGTPSYMAPEQATGRKDLTPAADVWSLGAILYELLTGRPPFQAASPVDTVLLVIEQEPVPPRRLDPAVDRDLEMICLKCLQKLPQLRYASASDLAQDLEAFVAGESLSAQPGGLRYFFARLLRETHHAEVLENWGLLWMWHSLAVFVLCLLTQVLDWSGVHDHLTYLILWSVGLITWGTILWQLRRRGGPVLFVERQIAHAWTAGVCASIGMFVIEVVIPLPVLQLSPAIAIAAGMVFIFKAGILSGRFYITASIIFLTAIVMSLLPQAGILIFGFVAALSFFLPGLKYYRLRRQALQDKR